MDRPPTRGRELARGLLQAEADVIAVIDNGEDYSDHALYFVRVKNVACANAAVERMKTKGWYRYPTLLAVTARMQCFGDFQPEDDEKFFR